MIKDFVAGATGAIGRPLMDELHRAGHNVVGMTQSAEGAAQLRVQGCDAVIANALDANEVESAVRSAHTEIIIGQLTSLPTDPSGYADAQPRVTLDSPLSSSLSPPLHVAAATGHASDKQC